MRRGKLRAYDEVHISICKRKTRLGLGLFGGFCGDSPTGVKKGEKKKRKKTVVDECKRPS